VQRSDFEFNNYQISGSHPPFAADSGDVASGTKNIIFEWTNPESDASGDFENCRFDETRCGTIQFIAD
jgi:hypothetical protein